MPLSEIIDTILTNAQSLQHPRSDRLPLYVRAVVGDRFCLCRLGGGSAFQIGIGSCIRDAMILRNVEVPAGARVIDQVFS